MKLNTKWSILMYCMILQRKIEKGAKYEGAAVLDMVSTEELLGKQADLKQLNMPKKQK